MGVQITKDMLLDPGVADLGITPPAKQKILSVLQYARSSSAVQVLSFSNTRKKIQKVLSVFLYNIHKP